MCSYNIDKLQSVEKKKESESLGLFLTKQFFPNIRLAS